MTRGHVTYDTDSRIKCYEPPVTISNGVEQVRDVRKYAGCYAVWAVTAGNVTAGKTTAAPVGAAAVSFHPGMKV